MKQVAQRVEVLSKEQVSVLEGVLPQHQGNSASAASLPSSTVSATGSGFEHADESVLGEAETEVLILLVHPEIGIENPARICSSHCGTTANQQ